MTAAHRRKPALPDMMEPVRQAYALHFVAAFAVAGVSAVGSEQKRKQISAVHGAQRQTVAEWQGKRHITPAIRGRKHAHVVGYDPDPYAAHGK